jgi:hypothetical protein
MTDRPLSRRRVLAGLSIATMGLAGCMRDKSPKTNESDGQAQNDQQDGMKANETDWRDVDWEKECGVQVGQWEPSGDPVARTVETERDEDEETAEQCALAAIDVALETLDQRLDTDMRDDLVWSLRDVEQSVKVGGQIWIDNSGQLRRCPPPEFNVESAREAIPKEVTVTLDFTDSEVQFECTHDFLLEVILTKDD